MLKELGLDTDVLEKFPFKKAENLRRVLIVTHRNADVDAYASAYGIAHLLKRLNSRCEVAVAAPDGLGAIAKAVHSEYPVNLVSSPNFDDLDMLVIVDTGHAQLLSDWLEPISRSNCSKMLIDHHPHSESVKTLVDHLLIDEESTSTCEIVLTLHEAKHVKIPRKVAEALLLGLITDTANLNLAECATLENAVKLCRYGATLSKARQKLRVKKDISEKIARLKAAQRLKIYRLEDWIVALTQVGSYQASAARALIDLGADVAVSLGEVDGEVRGSLRATQEFCEKSGVHLGIDVAEKVGSALKGAGGGHAGAASFTVKPPLQQACDRTLLTLAKKIDAELLEIT
ncbi:MAG: DHH family phosphoesterase [Nitrososphaerales archaeon]